MTQRTMTRTRALLLTVLVVLLAVVAVLLSLRPGEIAHAESLSSNGDVGNVTAIQEEQKDSNQSVYTSYSFSQSGTYTRINRDLTIDAAGYDKIYLKVTTVGKVKIVYNVTYHGGNVESEWLPFVYVKSDKENKGRAHGGYSYNAEFTITLDPEHVDTTYTITGYTRDYRYSASEKTIELIDKNYSAYNVRVVKSSDLAIDGDVASKTSVAATFSAGSSTYKLNGMNKGAYTSGTRLTAEGKYEITNTLATGRAKTVVGYVDKTPPTIDAKELCSSSSVSATFPRGAYESDVSATYTLQTKDGISTAPYASGQKLTAEGKYTITATDAAGNSSSITLIADKTPPVLTRSFEYGKSNGSVTFSSAAWESPITATYTLTNSSGTSKAQPYTSGQRLTADGLYAITATDKAGNSSTVKLVVDGKPPTLIFGDGTTGAMQMTRGSSSVSWKTEKYASPIDVVYSFISFDESKAPSLQNAPYTSGGVFAAEGTYEFTASDRAGNVAQATVIIDNTPPILTFSANGISFERYTNAKFTAVGSDALSGVDKIELYENGKYVPYDFAPRATDGEYLFRATDRAGNTTSATVSLYKTDTFGNLASIRDGYKLNAWYTVTLPARIFTTDSRDVAGRYSFESYDKALEFAVQNERAFRVTPVQGGFMYVSASNESVAQKYYDEQTLGAAVEKYAKGYVSARQVSSSGGNDRYYIETESLTRNSPILPDYLLDLKALPRCFARSAYIWSLPNISYISAMPYTVTAKYLGDYTEDITQSQRVIPRGSALGSFADYKQGWYLITESDAAGNVEQYLIYSDAELPTVRVTATTGDGEQDLTLDYDYTRNNTLYFISLELKGLLDNADPFVTLKLEKGSTVKYFTQGDALPVLGSDEFPSGKYTITVFDRSHNALVFDVYIAGAPPAMTHGSLAADKPECKINFVTSDRYNVITSITLYKIEYDGTKTALDTDGVGTPITAAALSYVLTVGGKYGATVTDNYRRTIELDPIFFLKGLPSGKLVGVADGGRTNNNVSFTFASADVCELYVLMPGGERRPFTDFTVQTGSTQTTYNITADDATSYEYLVFLHNAQDLSLFVEYMFEIDTILPEFEITDSDGNAIQPDGATNKSFKIAWRETGVSVRYYTAKGGSLSASKYNMNSVLSQGALYYFTLKDDVGNVLDFTVLLDNVVDYTLSGKYNEIDGVIYANSALTFTVNEPTQEFSVVNADGFTIENGGTLIMGGRYDITVTDNYRNTVTLCIVLDFAPPVLALVGADNGASVKTAVTVRASDYDYLYLTDVKGNRLKDVSDGETFSAAGRYYITASDHAGNTVTVSFSIDLSVDYTLSVPNGAVTTGSVTLDSAEPLNVTVKLDGVLIDASSTKFTVCGEYELALTDALGNSVSCVFVIVPARVREIELRLPVGTRILSVIRDGAELECYDASRLELYTTGVYTVALDCGGTAFEFVIQADNTPPIVTLTKSGGDVKVTAVDKEDVELKLTLDGSVINCRVGQTLDEPGHYVLTATDKLGNVAVYEWDIPYRLNTWAIVAICVGAVALVVVVILICRARRKPRMK